MQRALLILALALSGCAAATEQVETQSPVARGHSIVAANCSGCHAVETSGESPAPEAPPFRNLSDHYRVSMLQEALAEGISVGHPAMPNFQFAPDDVDAIVAYLETIQAQPDRGHPADPR